MHLLKQEYSGGGNPQAYAQNRARTDRFSSSYFQKTLREWNKVTRYHLMGIDISILIRQGSAQLFLLYFLLFA